VLALPAYVPAVAVLPKRFASFTTRIGFLALTPSQRLAVNQEDLTAPQDVKTKFTLEELRSEIAVRATSTPCTGVREQNWTRLLPGLIVTGGRV
jgi:hypothetical protein